jgi:hypothetical protein
VVIALSFSAAAAITLIVGSAEDVGSERSSSWISAPREGITPTTAEQKS